MSAGSGRGPWWVWLGLLGALLFDVWWRGHTVGPSVRERFGVAPWPVVRGEAEPLDCDEAAYAYLGRRIVRGDVLYRDLTENKPPLGYWIYTLGVAIGGASEWTVRLLPIPLVLATLGLVGWLGLRLGGPAAAVAGAWVFALWSTDPYLFGNGANLEHAINFFAVASLAAMVRAPRGGGRGWLLAAGFGVGAASLVKQVAGLNLLVFAAASALRERPGDGRARRGDVAALGLGFAAAWALAIAVLVARGAGAEAFDDIVRYGGALATRAAAEPNQPPLPVRWITGNADPRDGSLPWPFGATDYRTWWGAGSWPLWAAAVPAVAWLLIGPKGSGRRLLAAWTIGAWVQVALPGLFWQHYYLLPVPGAALAIAVLLGDALGALRAPRARGTRGLRRGAGLLATAAVLAAIGWTAVIQVRDYLLVEPTRLVDYKGGRQWVALRDLGRRIGRRTRGWGEPTLFVWGWQSPLFIYSNLDGVTPHFFADPLLKDKARSDPDDPMIRPRLDRIVRDVRTRRPALVFLGDPPFPALAEILRRDYVPAGPMPPDGRGLWIERGAYRRFEAEGRP